MESKSLETNHWKQYQTINMQINKKQQKWYFVDFQTNRTLTLLLICTEIKSFKNKSFKNEPLKNKSFKNKWFEYKPF